MLSWLFISCHRPSCDVIRTASKLAPARLSRVSTALSTNPRPPRSVFSNFPCQYGLFYPLKTPFFTGRDCYLSTLMILIFFLLQPSLSADRYLSTLMILIFFLFQPSLSAEFFILKILGFSHHPSFQLSSECLHFLLFLNFLHLFFPLWLHHGIPLPLLPLCQLLP